MPIPFLQCKQFPKGTLPITLLLYAFLSLALLSCQKYLEEKPDAKLTTPATLQDLQLMLDHYGRINNSYPAIAEVLADHYYLTGADWEALSAYFRSLYVWEENDENASAYSGPYATVLTCNTILDHLPLIEGEAGEKQRIRGSALFIRAAYYYGLAQLYAPPYDGGAGGSRPGLAIRRSSDYAPPSRRSTVEETYAFILEDLKEASLLLPLSQGFKTRPSRPAALGWLARTYLAMGRYEQAAAYADSTLQLYDSLMDFNTLNGAAAAPVPKMNREVIFQLRGGTAIPLAPASAKIDSLLYRSYAANDLRRTVYFRSTGNGNYAFKGDYDGSGASSGYVFAGVVTDEMYLIRAECHARAGQTILALQDLNTLLRSRWKTGTFEPLAAPTAAEALALVLGERRKELIGRGTRWTDLRRLRTDPVHAVVPRRLLGQALYELKPESPRYTLLFPAIVINQTGMEQNP